MRTAAARADRPTIIASNKCDLASVVNQRSVANPQKFALPLDREGILNCGRKSCHIGGEIGGEIGGKSGAQAEAGFLTNIATSVW